MAGFKNAVIYGILDRFGLLPFFELELTLWW